MSEAARPDKPRTYSAMVWRQFRRDWIAVGGLALIAVLFLVAIGAPVIANNKPVLMRWEGRLSSPMLREIFAPGGEVSEQFLECVFNYALVMTVASLVVLVPLWLAVRRRARRAAAMVWTAAALAVICLVPFLNYALALTELAIFTMVAFWQALCRKAGGAAAGGRVVAALAVGCLFPFLFELILTWRQLFLRGHNFALVLTVAVLFATVLLWLSLCRKAWGVAALGWSIGAIAIACLFAILTQVIVERLQFNPSNQIVQSRLDKTDYRAMAVEARAQPGSGNWVIMAPLPFGPFEQTTAWYSPPTAVHPMGTDSSSRDVLSRIIHGARVSLSVGFLSMGVAVMIGLFVGAVSAYHLGWVDLLLQRLVEVVICFPTFLLILTIMAFVDKRSIFNVMLVIGLTGWTGVTRLVRGQMLGENAKDYVVAAHALGASSWRIMFRHLLPNSIAPVFVAITFGVAGAILTESGLSFLGFGVSPPTASWGELLNQALSNPTGYWWLTVWPGVMIFVTVTVYNLVGEGMRDALDPRLKI